MSLYFSLGILLESRSKWLTEAKNEQFRLLTIRTFTLLLWDIQNIKIIGHL